jgi:hypothetical protein
MLDGDLETGRSWELPVAVGHLLRDRGAIASVEETDVESDACLETTRQHRQGEADLLVWATGKLDANLAPVADDYRLDLKLSNSEALLSHCKAEGRKIIFAIPDGLEPTELKAIETAAARWDARLFVLANSGALEDMVRALIGAALSEPSCPAQLAQETSKKPPSRTFSSNRAAWAIGGVAAVFALVAGLSAWNISDPSTTGSAGELESLHIERLDAATLDECHDAIYNDRAQFKATPLRRNGDLYQVGSGDGLCGLRFMNVGRSALRLTVEPTLMNSTVIGNQTIFSADGERLAPTWEAVVYFSEQPPPGDYTLEVAASARLRAKLRFEESDRALRD